MKRWFTRAAAAVLALYSLISPVLAAQTLRQSSLPLSDHLTLRSSFLDTGETQKEHVLTYTPGGDVTPMVVYGDTLYGRSTMDYIEEYVADKGYTAVAAVNASFFDMKNGVPLGMVVTDGILRTSGNAATVGISANGTLQIGRPTLEVTIAWEDYSNLLHYNKVLTKNNGMVLYSRDYDSKTKGTVEGYHVILEPEEDQLTLDSSMTARVRKLTEKTESCTIPVGCFVLSLAEENEYEPAQNAIRSLEVGDVVTLSTSIDRDWKAVSYAVAGGDLLVEGGRALTEFTLDSAGRQAPRTALGIKANGDVVVCTVDRSEISAGMTLEDLARRMEELGCVTAINLDGGGSTCMGVTQPGESIFTTVNDPSDGRQRACANYLFFVRPKTKAGAAARLFVYPYDLAVLPGGQVELTAKAADANYMAAQLPGAVSWSASNGTVSGGVFTAGGPGTAVVTAQSGSLSGSADIQVVETPTAMEIRRQGGEEPLDALLVECGTDLDLTAQAWYLGVELAAQDGSFTWEVSEGLGTISREGIFTAAEEAAKGELTVSCGDLSVSIPLEIRVNPFIDTKSHWAREPISQLYFREVLKGSENAEGDMVYRPDDSMTRQEFVVALIRWLGVDTGDYAGAELPFADEERIASWALDAMKAAYELEYLSGSEDNGKVYAEPTATITREAAMTILARTQNASSDSNALEQFADEKTVSPWARPALTAMVEKSIINGIDGWLQPKGKVTRAQVAKMLFAME